MILLPSHSFTQWGQLGETLGEVKRPVTHRPDAGWDVPDSVRGASGKYDWQRNELPNTKTIVFSMKTTWLRFFGISAMSFCTEAVQNRKGANKDV